MAGKETGSQGPDPSKFGNNKLGEIRFIQTNGRVTGFEVVLGDNVEIHNRSMETAIAQETDKEGQTRVVLREIGPKTPPTETPK